MIPEIPGISNHNRAMTNFYGKRIVGKQFIHVLCAVNIITGDSPDIAICHCMCLQIPVSYTHLYKSHVSV